MLIVNPILAEMVRGNLIESFCRGAYVIVNADGEVIDEVGDIKRPVYARSSLKPLQALAVISSGAFQRYDLSDRKLALSCASHNGEEDHVGVVRKWLQRLELDEQILECGPIWPAHAQTAQFHMQNKDQPSRLYHMCSGKHLGFITVAAHQGHKLNGYTDWHHPVQVYNRDVISEVCDIDLHKAPQGIDGCQAPVVALSLQTFAYGLAQLASPHKISKSLKNSSEQVVNSMKQYPYYVAGTERFCTDIAIQSQGQVLAKMGAEGVFSVIIPSKGWGIALKIDDGHLKGAEVALAKVLHKHNLLDGSAFLRPPVLNSNQQEIGWWQ